MSVTVILVISILFYIDFCISFVYIFKKAHINKKYALIPFYNLYQYTKICEMEPLILLIPIANIIFLLMIPFQLGHMFSQSKLISLAGCFFPFIFYPYLAFSRAEYIHKEMQKPFLRSIEDIDNLEQKLIHQEEQNESIENQPQYGKKAEKNNTINNVDRYIKEIESNSQKKEDDYFTDEDLQVAKKNMGIQNLLKNTNPEIEELDENEEIKSNEEINALEKNIIKNESIKVEDISNYQEVKKQEEEVNVIAFGNLSSKKNEKEQKHELICPYCHASMIGFHKTCPGCGRDISNLMNDIQKD